MRFMMLELRTKLITMVNDTLSQLYTNRTRFATTESVILIFDGTISCGAPIVRNQFDNLQEPNTTKKKIQKTD